MGNLVRMILLQLPKPVYEFLRQKKRHYKERKFFSQSLTQIKCGAYQLQIQNHLLLSLHKFQPYRDLCVGVVAKYIAAKYPGGTIVDIGANVGDTAALIATYSKTNYLVEV